MALLAVRAASIINLVCYGVYPTNRSWHPFRHPSLVVQRARGIGRGAGLGTGLVGGGPAIGGFGLAGGRKFGGGLPTGCSGNGLLPAGGRLYGG